MNFEIAPRSTETLMNWYDAKVYCFSLNIDGKSGWRLPTKEELNEMYEKYQSENDCDSEQYSIDWHYWSSTEFDESFSWGHGFGSGNPGINTKSFSGRYARAVRDI